MKRNSWIVFVVILVIVVGAYFLFSGVFNIGDKNNNIPVGTDIGQQAPDFTLKKLNGDDISLSDLRGKKVFLNFWATWCPPCRLEMPDITKLDKERQDVAVLAVNLREEKGQIAEFLMTNGYNFTVALDQKGKVGDQYLVRGIPTTYIIDEQRVIINKHTGALNYQQMLDLLEIK